MYAFVSITYTHGGGEGAIREMVVGAMTGGGRRSSMYICIYIDWFRMDVVVCSTDTSKPVFRVSADHQTHARRINAYKSNILQTT